MTKVIVISFVLTAVPAEAGCVRADRVRAWREALNPSAPDVPDAAFVVARLLFFSMAAVMLFRGFRLMAVADNGTLAHLDHSTVSDSGRVVAVSIILTCASSMRAAWQTYANRFVHWGVEGVLRQSVVGSGCAG
ncbi:hypothetical protein C1I97_08685 [Streptomyces sp. NTH33]|uniref:hypothetical protein n=1 Tax=Streptomyces sp. NTH33 TaxID=1735453 RepID=UPI000DA831A8|nr:hypothetical protein [Streptomyces sp. NTH33]PZH15255.1 hypothetical protein C1I97_08685 [Streptomyces sp. NTH33]